MSDLLKIATRQSPLALKQTDLAARYLKAKLPDAEFEVMAMTTTGDQQAAWSLEQEGGKGLFTKELELALLGESADIAVHSAKDMPTELPEGLDLVGYLPREDARDVLVMREGLKRSQIKTLATGSPRRRAQIISLIPGIEEVIEIRGRVTTRLDKIAQGYADATIVAAAGLRRLGIESRKGLIFDELSFSEMVPAVGQGIIGIEARVEDRGRFEPLFDADALYAATVERTFLKSLGGGCHAAYAAHYVGGRLHIFHQEVGYFEVGFEGVGFEQIQERIQSIIEEKIAK